MKHLGDITKIDWSAVEPVDVVTGGSPCQDLSVAGKRAGLAGERSGLYMEQIRCIKELREADVLRGRTGEFIRPRYMVWENVPGAFSSGNPKGADFAAVIEEIIKVAEQDAYVCVMPPSDGWRKSGCYYDSDGRWSIAWRVHDAQFWGVPQRRKRISLVADFGGLSAPEILFERKGLSGHFEQSGAQRESAAAAVRDGAAVASGVVSKGNGECFLTHEKHTSLSIGGGQAGQGYPCVMRSAGFSAGQGAKAGGIGYAEECSPSLKAAASGTNMTPAVMCLNDQGGSVMSVSEDVSGCLRAQEHGHQPILLESNQNHATIQTDGVCTALPAAMGMGGGYVPMVTGTYQNVTGPLMANSHPGSYCGQDAYQDMLVASFAAGGFGKYEAGVGTLRASGGDYGGGTETLAITNIVRRLTPLECERLQGYPDGWTDIGEWVDSKGKRHKEADSPRYKALGNSIALPFWCWLARRISAQYERDITIGSLFDGIGGFPYAFEKCGGKALWASEIEEFPMAVTKMRFPELLKGGEGE